MKVALIDYGAGNLMSVRKALAFLQVEAQTPQTPKDLSEAAAIIVPGVGHFKATVSLDTPWQEAILNRVAAGRPILGICLGMHWLFNGSSEAPDLSGLGLVKGFCFLLYDPDVTKAASSPNLTESERRPIKIPHVGWNSLNLVNRSWLLNGIDEGAQVYFTHSFAPPVTAECSAATTHGVRFASVVEHDHICGVQFHPEKSGSVGLTILKNFLAQASRQ